ncbi:MAG: flagellar hook assembly protein FlgD [Betaproteobacteria bacterium]|nr:flagellar hook assembly protein FlgD [Betaproteobacteria bacterium]
MSTTSGVTSTVGADVLSAVNTRQTTNTSSAMEDTKNQFLTMLTTQLKNQDPMNPMDNAQMTTQLAQINMVDGINQVNANLLSILDNFQMGEMTQAAAMVGRAVLVQGSGLQLADGMSVGGFELTSPADNVTASIFDANGRQVATVNLGEADVGSHVFLWDGMTDSGDVAADGDYTVKLSAVQAGAQVDITGLQLGTVTNVIRNGNSADLQVGQLGIFKMSDIRQILS